MPPPGVGLKTAILNVPVTVKSEVKIVAVNCPEFTNVVTRSEPSNLTTEEDMKFVPLTVRVKPVSPTVLLVGEIFVVVGTGLFTVNV